MRLDWGQYVEIDSKYYRPAVVDMLVGEAKPVLGWIPCTPFKEHVRLMVDADRAELVTRGAGA